MKCAVSLGRCHSGNVKMKNVNSYLHKESNFDNIIDHLCTKLEDINDCEVSKANPHMRTVEHTDAVQRYCAAFPALNKGEELPLQYFLPPPAWCRKNLADHQANMQTDLMSKDYLKSKKFTGKERRNSYHGSKKGNRKRYNSYSRSFESKENLPEWMTHEGEWNMENQDPVKEFIRALAFDEGYGTCENTVTDDIREIAMVNLKIQESKVPDWDDNMDFDTRWVNPDDLKPKDNSPTEQELYAKFQAKFDHSLEALWSKDQANTPDDEYQDLPIDFQDLLSSPTDNQFINPSAEKCSMISLTESIWSNDGHGGAPNRESPSASVEVLHDRFKPLNLQDETHVMQPPSPMQEMEPFSLYSYEGIYEAVPCVADMIRSLTAINHSRNYSSFKEVIPRRNRKHIPIVEEKPSDAKDTISSEDEDDADDLLTSTKTHFRPICKEAETVEKSAIVRYADGETFEISDELDSVTYHRSESGYMYLEGVDGSPQPYLEFRTRSVNYERLNLTEKQRAEEDFYDDRMRLKFPMSRSERAVQTERPPTPLDARAAWGVCDECGRGGGAKKMRASDIQSIWSEADACSQCSVAVCAATLPEPEELSRDWEELLSDISAVHAQHAFEGDGGVAVDRKRRHSTALRCAHASCSHPHAPFLHCLGLDRPLTR